MTLCPFCGAYSTRACEIEDDETGAQCPWLDVLEDENSDLSAAIDDRVEASRNQRATLSPKQGEG